MRLAGLSFRGILWLLAQAHGTPLTADADGEEGV